MCDDVTMRHFASWLIQSYELSHTHGCNDTLRVGVRETERVWGERERVCVYEWGMWCHHESARRSCNPGESRYPQKSVMPHEWMSLLTHLDGSRHTCDTGAWVNHESVRKRCKWGESGYARNSVMSHTYECVRTNVWIRHVTCIHTWEDMSHVCIHVKTFHMYAYISTHLIHETCPIHTSELENREILDSWLMSCVQERQRERDRHVYLWRVSRFLVSCDVSHIYTCMQYIHVCSMPDPCEVTQESRECAK